ncbi:hypothetical protein D9611_004284 [Ephemerocybe angulata]|uniref:Uncharacterized protein n=1 Tax=Ephemerocybe angulata TaxID=980116 RepID=A0A8H5BJD7_9AGAR|nr:hypothetical protein D9611_004284 [Tulosesus angulatus]
MHRFRKNLKSDVKRAGLSPPQDLGPLPPTHTDGSERGGSTEQLHHLDFLPATDDFRTSLILPDLSRRFSLLRTPAGDPVTIDDLRSKFAEQRAKGVDQTISEEEEDMLLETLGKLKGRRYSGSHSAERSGDSASALSDEGQTEESSVSSATVKSLGGKGGSGSGANTSGSSPAKAKRYSNNLFGSGRLRDYTYLRSVASSRNSAGGSSKAASITPSEESTHNPRLANTTSFADSIASSSSTPPTDSNADESVLSLPSTGANDQGSVRSTSSSVNEAISAAEYRLQKSLGPAGLKRASVALENVIREIEDEELEEEIVMPRSTPIPRNHTDHLPQFQNTAPFQQKMLGEGFGRDSSASMLSSVIEAGMAISSDKPMDDADDTNGQRGPSPVPLGHVPGYIPGMPRPMTPRDFDMSFAEEQRSHSTTPRATSPMHGSFTLSEAGSAAASISNILRRESISSRQSPRPTTPLFLSRSPHGAHSSISNSPTSGRFTPVDDASRSRIATDLNSSTNSNPSYDFAGRRRPASPLSNPPLHGLSALSTSPPGTPSRPTTPSNIVWGVRPDSGASPQSQQGRHSRDNSWASEGESDIYGSVGETDDDGQPGYAFPGMNGTTRPLRSPPRSDSPGPEKGQLSRSWTFKASQQAANGAARSMSPVNGEVAQYQISPSQRSNHRSLTPTQNAPRSPGSPTFGSMDSGSSSRAARRSSRQNGYTSSPFNLGPLPTLALNPRANMSSSSLESAGSSFHSWEGEKDKVLNLFNDTEVQPAWHAISASSSSGKSSTTSGTTASTSRTSPEEDWHPDDIVRNYAGLRRGDFAMIHEKLVTVAKSTEHRGSALRKRRPSTSQSNYSVRDTRVASPPPPSSPTVNMYPNAREQQQLHVLNSCIDPKVMAPVMAHSNSSSSFDRTNRNLAKILFGPEEDESEADSQTNGAFPSAVLDQADASKAPTTPSAFTEDNSTPEETRPISPNNNRTPTTPSGFTLNRNPSTARIPPQTPQEQAALTLEVQQKVEAATLALRKRPSQEGLSHSPSISRTKRIDPSQISKPLLVSSSTSVDTIPLKTPVLSAGNGSGPSKIGSRFKKLRGSLRAKNVLAVEESVAPNSDPKISPNSQTANYDPEKLKSPGAPAIVSATDPGRFKVNVPSPPASAGPGLKGFMARFRTKRATRPEHYRNQFSSPVPSTSPSLPTTSEVAENDDDNAIHQLFKAANNLGIDQGALNDLLKRSGSLTAKSLLNPGNGAPVAQTPPAGNPHGQHLTVPPIQQPNLSSSSGSDYTATPGMFNSSPVSDLSVGNNFLFNEEAATADEPTGKGPTKRPEHLRRARDLKNEANPVVRRTLIFADPRQSTVDPAATLRRNKSKRRTSVQSASNRSIHDRVPTPPPSKTPQAKRFSHEASPPVPQLPHALGGPPDNLLNVPSGQLEKSNSAAYELYGDSRSGSMMVDPNHPDFGRGEPLINPEPGTGVEVIQLANGDIIWNVVNGLRDDDDESLYTGRNSIGSEYSTQESGGNMQVFVKEHTRASSKGSNSSFVSRKKMNGGKSRPETKVLYGSPEQIGRLIESVSQGMDAGSFNFAPSYARPGHGGSHHGQAHSATSSLSTNDWAINEIDNILTSINRP